MNTQAWAWSTHPGRVKIVVCSRVDVEMYLIVSQEANKLVPNCLFHLYCSKLDEDNLYMAYADIMAKVRPVQFPVVIFYFLY